jgi:hypothetical protein
MAGLDRLHLPAHNGHANVDYACRPITPPVEASGEDFAAEARSLAMAEAPVKTARPARRRLGPLVVWQQVDTPLGGRLYALAIALMSIAALGVAARMTPSRNHLGTHRQLGLPPCAFVAMTGFPCPTCGMTTAYACTVRGRLIEAVRASVFGSIMAVGTAALAVLGLVCAVTGRYPNINWYRVDAVKVVYFAALLLVVSWAFKIAWGLLDGSLPVR